MQDQQGKCSFPTSPHPGRTPKHPVHVDRRACSCTHFSFSCGSRCWAAALPDCAWASAAAPCPSAASPARWAAPVLSGTATPQLPPRCAASAWPALWLASAVTPTSGRAAPELPLVACPAEVSVEVPVAPVGAAPVAPSTPQLPPCCAASAWPALLLASAATATFGRAAPSLLAQEAVPRLPCPAGGGASCPTAATTASVRALSAATCSAMAPRHPSSSSLAANALTSALTASTSCVRASLHPRHALRQAPAADGRSTPGTHCVMAQLQMGKAPHARTASRPSCRWK